VDLPVTAGIAAVLAGIGYAAWRWLIRRLRACEDRVAQLEEERRRAWPGRHEEV
jgi:HAMP domain-containing protein